MKSIFIIDLWFKDFKELYRFKPSLYEFSELFEGSAINITDLPWIFFKDV